MIWCKFATSFFLILAVQFCEICSKRENNRAIQLHCNRPDQGDYFPVQIDYRDTIGTPDFQFDDNTKRSYENLMREYSRIIFFFERYEMPELRSAVLQYDAVFCTVTYTHLDSFPSWITKNWYHSSALGNRVAKVNDMMVAFIKYLIEDPEIKVTSLDSVYLAGSGLGANLAGMVGEQLQQFNLPGHRPALVWGYDLASKKPGKRRKAVPGDGSIVTMFEKSTLAKVTVRIHVVVKSNEYKYPDENVRKNAIAIRHFAGLILANQFREDGKKISVQSQYDFIADYFTKCIHTGRFDTVKIGNLVDETYIITAFVTFKPGDLGFEVLDEHLGKDLANLRFLRKLACDCAHKCAFYDPLSGITAKIPGP